jgi:hypothetical protein
MKTARIRVAIAASCLTGALSSAQGAAVTGELKARSAVTVTFEGPETSESATPNPFRDYRLTVTFSQGDRQWVVPGHYAADGNAAETSAVSGNRWRAHFVPDQPGEWRYEASLRTGSDIAIREDDKASRAVALDGASGTFEVQPLYANAGMVRYVGLHHLVVGGQGGPPFLKAGADSPENWLGYADFDGTYDTGGRIPDFLHRFEPHIRDWQPDDPTWQGGKGKGIIGALNYLAIQGVNSIYFLTYNIDGGDGADTWPWTSHEERYRFDCSKLDQWEIVFSHMDRLGIQLHEVTQEAENDRKLGGDGSLNAARKLYYRELLARFAHHRAVVWNLGEENHNPDGQRKAFAETIRRLDPYDHPITVHTFYGKADTFYNGLLGDPNFEMTSIQGNAGSYNDWVIRLRERSRQAGRPWVICGDEQGPPVKKDLSNLDQLRREALWGNLMGGGGGVEWYCGYESDFGDLQSEDFRVLEPLWQQTKHAIDFFDRWAVPYGEAQNELSNGLCLALPGQMYVVYLPNGGEGKLNLGKMKAEFGVGWYNPRTGGQLIRAGTVAGPGVVSLGEPPSEKSQDWVVLLRGGPTELAALTVLHGYAEEHGYPVGCLVRVVADPPEPGQVFDHWEGDVEVLEDPASPRAWVTIPEKSVMLIAAYKEGRAEHAVTHFVLIDAETDQPIAEFDPLKDGAIINLRKLPTRELNIRAVTKPEVTGSVRFRLDGNDSYRIENTAPYALGGDNLGDYSPWTPAVGKHTVTATPYTEQGAVGEAGTPLTIAFEVVAE